MKLKEIKNCKGINQEIKKIEEMFTDDIWNIIGECARKYDCYINKMANFFDNDDMLSKCVRFNMTIFNNIGEITLGFIHRLYFLNGMYVIKAIDDSKMYVDEMNQDIYVLHDGEVRKYIYKIGVPFKNSKILKGQEKQEFLNKINNNTLCKIAQGEK